MWRSTVADDRRGHLGRLLPVHLEPLLELRDLAGALDLDVELDVVGEAGLREVAASPTSAWEPMTALLACVMYALAWNLSLL